MLTQPLLQQLHELRLRGMAPAFEQQLTTLAANDLNFEERLGLLIQHELIERQACRLRQRLRWAKFPQIAALEDLDLKAARGIDRAALGQVTDLGWIRERLNVIVTGPTGVGKSFLACAVGHAACRADHSVRCFRLPRLIDELTRHSVLQTKSTFLRQIAKADLLILDDFGLTPLPDQIRRDLLEIFDDRYDRRSTLITSQLPTRSEGRLDAQTKNGGRCQNDKRSLTKTAVSTKVFTSCLNRPGMPWTRGPSSGGNTGRHAWNQQALSRKISSSTSSSVIRPPSARDYESLLQRKIGD